MIELSKILTLVGIGIGGLSYVCKEGIDSLERTKSSLDDELAAYRSSLTQQTTQIQLLKACQQMESLHRESLPEIQKRSPNVDYSGMITRDSGAVKETQARMRVGADDLRQLINKIPFRTAKLRQNFEQLNAGVEAAERQTNETLKPSPENDWVRASQLKLAITTTVLSDLPFWFLETRLSRKRRIK